MATQVTSDFNVSGESPRIVSRAHIARSVRAFENWIVLAVILGTVITAWVHLQNTSIWYDEAITMLTTSGHAKLDWALGVSQFKPSADLRKIVLSII